MLIAGAVCKEIFLTKDATQQHLTVLVFVAYDHAQVKTNLNIRLGVSLIVRFIVIVGSFSFLGATFHPTNLW